MELKPNKATANEHVHGSPTLMRYDFDVFIGSGTKEMVAVFDSRDISQKEVEMEIKAYPLGYDKRILLLPKNQFELVFRSVLES